MSAWLIQNKVIIDIIATIGASIAVGFSAIALLINARAFRLRRKSEEANLFHNISGEINSLLKEEREHVDNKGKRKRSYINWLDRLLIILFKVSYFLFLGKIFFHIYTESF